MPVRTGLRGPGALGAETTGRRLGARKGLYQT
jgi:hypothetical protein